MAGSLITLNDAIDTEIVSNNLPVARNKKTTKNEDGGISTRQNQDGSKTFYIRYYKNGKLFREKVGKNTEGINRQYCKQLRASRIALDRLGELAPAEIKKAKKKNARTIDSIAQEYLEVIKDLSDGKTTKGRYNNHLMPVFGRKNLDDITTEDVETFKQKKLKEISFKTGRTYSNKSVNDMINLLNTLYRFAIDKYNLPIMSPARGKSRKNRGSGGVERLNEDNARKRYLDEDEIALLYKKIDSRVGKDDVTFALKLCVALGLSTGARIASLLNIQKKDINLNQGTVTIKDFKNKSTYTGFMSDRVITLLDGYIQTLRATDCVIGGNMKQKHRSGLNKALQPILNELFNDGLEANDAQNRVVIHTLRHTFGSLLAINGTPIFTIKKLMNHNSIEMTIRYAKLAPDQGRENVKRLNI